MGHHSVGIGGVVWYISSIRGDEGGGLGIILILLMLLRGRVLLHMIRELLLLWERLL